MRFHEFVLEIFSQNITRDAKGQSGSSSFHFPKFAKIQNGSGSAKKWLPPGQHVENHIGIDEEFQRQRSPCFSARISDMNCFSSKFSGKVTTPLKDFVNGPSSGWDSIAFWRARIKSEKICVMLFFSLLAIECASREILHRGRKVNFVVSILHLRDVLFLKYYTFFT